MYSRLISGSALTCFRPKIEDNLEFGITWQKPYIIYMKCQKCVHPDLEAPFTLGHVQMLMQMVSHSFNTNETLGHHPAQKLVVKGYSHISTSNLHNAQLESDFLEKKMMIVLIYLNTD